MLLILNSDPGKKQTMKLPVLPVDVFGLGKLGNDILDAKAAAPNAAAFGASSFSICCASGKTCQLTCIILCLLCSLYQYYFLISSACCSILSLVLSAMPLIMLIIGMFKLCYYANFVYYCKNVHPQVYFTLASARQTP